MQHPVIARSPAAKLQERLCSLTLLLPLDGDLHYRTGCNERVRLARGELLIVRGGEGVTLSGGPGASDALLFRADPRWVRAALCALGVESPLPTPDVCVLPASSALTRRAITLLQGMHVDGASGAPGDRLGRAARWIELLGLAFEARGEVEQRTARSSRRGDFLRAVEALRAGSLEDCTLSGLAARLGLSERQVSRLFREEIGTSFQGYVASLRLRRAKRLLADTDLPITEIAFESGWRSLSQFNFAFRRETSQTPGAYRSSLPMRSPQ